jgi:hypothetical protein
MDYYNREAPHPRTGGLLHMVSGKEIMFVSMKNDPVERSVECCGIGPLDSVRGKVKKIIY